MKELFELIEKVPPSAQIFLLLLVVWDMRKRQVRDSKRLRTLVAINTVFTKTLDVSDEVAKQLPADDDEDAEE